MGRAAGDTPFYQFDLLDKGTGKHLDVNIEFISVTSVISAVLAKPFLVTWAYNYTRDAISGLASQFLDSTLEHDLVETLADAEKLEEYLKENGLRPADYVSERSDEGTEAHAYLERLCLEHAISPARALSLAAKSLANKPAGFETAVAKWWRKNKPNPVASEKFMVSMSQGVAGTLDLAWTTAPGETAGVEDPALGIRITDLKSRKEGAGAYESDHVQVAQYGAMWDETTGQPHTDRSVLIVRPDGTYTETPSTMDAEVFAGLLAVFNRLKGGK